MHSNSLIIGLVMLIVGAGGGYAFAQKSTATPVSSTHTMSDGSTMSDTMAGMTQNLEGKTGDAFDRAFIEEMIIHHEGAVSMARLAQERAQHAEIKQLSEEIITAQMREISMMQGWLTSWYNQ